jgi:hypothetical protein
VRNAGIAAIAGLVLGLVIAACAHTPVMPRQDPRRDEITALWAQTRDWRREAGMELEPDGDAVVQMERMSVRGAAAVCEPPPSPPDGCVDVCGLADAICDNAERICDLAGELKGDDWAAGKCSDAKASCREATQRCCSCASGAGA